MTNPQPAGPNEPIKPFGTQPRRSSTPLVLWTIVYVVWLGVLLWMLLFHTKPV